MIPQPPAPQQRVVWTFVYAAFLCYVFAVTTFRLPIGEASMIAGLLGLVLQQERIRLPALLAWSAVFLGWCLLGYFRSPFPAEVWANVILLGKLCLIMLVAANALRSPAQLRFFMIFFLACYALFPVRGAFVNYFSNYTLFGRALWNYTYDNPNDLAALSLLVLSVAASLLATERTPWIRWCAIAGLAILPLLILMTQSRGGFVALCVFTAVALFTQHHRRRLQTLAIVALLGLGVAAAAPSGVWTRVKGLAQITENLDNVDPEGSAKSRYQIWQVATTIIHDYPLTGVGWGAYALAHANYAAVSDVDPSARGARDTHSTYLNVLAETGYLGLLLFLGLLWSVVRRAERARRWCRPVLPRLAMQLMYLELGLLAFLVAGVFGSFAKLSFLYLHLVLLWAATQNAVHAVLSRRAVVVNNDMARVP